MDFDFNKMQEEAGRAPRPPSPSSHVKLYNSGRFSDLKIECQGRVWNVHKAVVIIKCEFFNRMLENDVLETNTGVIRLPDDDPDTVARLIQFLYTGDYDDSNSPPPQVAAVGSRTDKNPFANLPVIRPSQFSDVATTLAPTRRSAAATSKKSPGRKAAAPKVKGVTVPQDKRAIAGPVAPIMSLAPIGGTKAFVDHVRVWILADKCLVPELATLALKKYSALAKSKNWAADGFFHSVELAYSDEVPPHNRAFKHEVSVLIYVNRNELLEVDGFADMMTNHGEIGLDLLRFSAKDPFRRLDNAIKAVWRCSGCSSNKSCIACGSDGGGYLLPPKGYEIARAKQFLENEWGYQCENCGTVNLSGCDRTDNCQGAAGKYIDVDSFTRERPSNPALSGRPRPGGA